MLKSYVIFRGKRSVLFLTKIVPKGVYVNQTNTSRTLLQIVGATIDIMLVDACLSILKV